MRVEAKHLEDNIQYSARGIVARLDKIGVFQAGMLALPVYRYLTLDCGSGNEDQDFAVQFIGKAPFLVDEVTGERFLDMSRLKPGQIVINPGFIYERVPWSTSLRLAHTAALQNYKRKDIIVADKDDAPQIDLGEIDLTGATEQ